MQKNKRELIQQILEVARFAPSGDNTQPWRFHFLEDETLCVTLVSDAADSFASWNGGKPLLLQSGGLLECIRIAAAEIGWQLNYKAEIIEAHQVCFYVTFVENVSVRPDPLYAQILRRATDRRPYHTHKLTQEQKTTLENSLGEGFKIIWLESWKEKWSFLRPALMARDVQLRMREGFDFLNKSLVWEDDYPEEGMPVASIPFSGASKVIMRWALKDWKRIDTLNRLGVGTMGCRIEVDTIPTLRSGAVFLLLHPEKDDGLEEGMAMQRFWLTLAQLGLVMQPNFAPLVFSAVGAKADRVKAGMEALVPQGLSFASCFFAGRVGTPLAKPLLGRAMRLPVEKLFQVRAS